MKPLITTLHQASFKESGKISFEDFPLDFEAFEKELDKTFSERERENPFLKGRDLWRDSSFLKQALLKKIAPFALELLSKKTTRLVADQLFSNEIKKGPIQDFFGFEPLLFAISIQENILTIFHPSMPITEKEHYVAVFGRDSTRYIKKETDPANHLPKKQGLGFGDLLPNDLHPLIFSH